MFSTGITSCTVLLLSVIIFLSHICPALLDLFFSSDTSICSKMAFPPLGNSDHVAVSVSIDFPTYSKRNAPFHLMLISLIVSIRSNLTHLLGF